MDSEVFKIEENDGEPSTSKQGVEKTQQFLEPSEKPDDKESKLMQDMGSGLNPEELADVAGQPVLGQVDNNEVLEKKVAETPREAREEENPTQKGQKKKPKNPFMPQVAAKNKTTQKKNEDQNIGAGSVVAEVL
nr:putative novel protein [Danio rerio]